MNSLSGEVTQRRPLWDIPTRVFHWSVVCLLPLAWWSADQQRFEVHQWAGYTLLVLVLSRFVWGIVGSRHSRFTDFLVGPAEAKRYIQGGGARSQGHNPLGRWSVMLLLTLLLAQAVSGLFNSDDILFSGPLYYWANSDVQSAMGVVHEVVFNALLALVGLHVCAVCFYQLHRREKLIQAMITGSAPGKEGLAPAVSKWRLVPILILVSAGLWLLIAQAPAPVYLGF